MIRLSLLAVYIVAAALYARKDWFVSLCALILLMAVVEHPDMPKGMLGIPGLNPWNLLFMVVVFAWMKAREQEQLTWDMPPAISVLLVLYLGVVLVGWMRMIVDADSLHLSAGSLISEQLINTVKWVIPGLILFDAARTRRRFRMAVFCVLAIYFLWAVQVIRWMPLSSAVSGEALGERSVKILVNEVGFHRVNMSAMLAGGAWAIFAARPLAETAAQRMGLLAAFAAVVLGQALTAGRAGYLTWMAVGFILCMLRWRKYLVLAPVLVLAVLTLAPGVAERMLEGFSQTTAQTGAMVSGESGADIYTITAGRNLAWPLVIDKIKERPLVGWGRLAMIRTGITAKLAVYKEGFSHPHNAYLEWLLDNGLIGFLLVMPFYALVLWKSVMLFLDSRDPVLYATGGICAAFLLALAVASSGSQTFYPREGWMGMWCAIGLMLRVHLERRRWFDVRATAGVRGTSWRSATPRAAAKPVAAVVPAPAPAMTLRRRSVPLTVDLFAGQGTTPAQPATGQRPVSVPGKRTVRPSDVKPARAAAPRSWVQRRAPGARAAR